MSKVVFLKLIPQSLDVSSHAAAVLHDSRTRERSAIVIRKTDDNLLNFQGHDPIPCRDKYRCWVLFKNVAKGLLGISEDTAISIRFADPPYTTVSDIASILTEPRHVVSLVVSPLGVACSDKLKREVQETKGLDKRDPYCRYRERYRSRDTVRTKCSFAEMNKLLSQLSEVSLRLQRTQEECDEIARRCRRKNAAKNGTHVRALEKQSAGNSKTGADYTSDNNVEKLLHIAESLTSHIIKMNNLKVPEVENRSTSREDSPDSSVLPDCPTDVCVRPNFSGGLYVMWNPVRLDAQDENHDHRVLGYTVYVGGQQRARVEGPLASQAELYGLDCTTDCHIQVCTNADLCNSLLTPVVSYRHTNTRRDPQQPTVSKTSSQSSRHRKTAKVESWLKNGHMDSRLDTTFSGDSSCTNSGLLGSPAHVHFAKMPDQMTTHTELDGISSNSEEDVQSTTSSHTSGIVTDLPISPKLSPACPCNDCTPHSASSLVNPRSHPHSQQDTPTNALCYSPILSTFSADNTTIDTVIDEPLDMDSVSSFLNLSSGSGETYTLAAEAGAGGGRHKAPAAPQNVRVKSRHAGCLCVSWTPVSRDSQGRSNGYFVLGYRIYVNGRSHKSVDGSMVFEALLQHPVQATAPYHKLKVHVRTRSMSGESVPSDTVTYDLQLHKTVEPRGRAKLDSALSSAASSTSLCRDSPHSQQAMGTGRHHSPGTGQKLETYV